MESGDTYYEIDISHVTGSTINILNYLQQTMNFSIELKMRTDHSWDGMFHSLLNGDVDVIAAAASNTLHR